MKSPRASAIELAGRQAPTGAAASGGGGEEGGDPGEPPLHAARSEQSGRRARRVFTAPSLSNRCAGQSPGISPEDEGSVGGNLVAQRRARYAGSHRMPGETVHTSVVLAIAVLLATDR